MTVTRPLAALLLITAAGLLSACQSLTPEQQRATDERTCAGYGFRPQTDAMARCLLDLELDRRADMRAFQTRSSLMFDRPVILERRVIVERQ
ncbi:hypothetical protein SAMN05880590_101496 [Rhizobium sp. RU35A]|uniref:hypothetical protein n=1 Tax=Rhizobium sp. RU35A TaxID=1907414 RepID=UPI000955C68D|nr:hypothetical protein [Rhizobium sp. RU35A]SIP96757.1 hypothetical protein SAMN05880590_101496 [Rhizobium sp. RU35A]